MKKINIFKSHRISTSIKVRVYKQYVELIFLYNCELWTLTPTREKQINSFQRRQMRVAINIRHPKTMCLELLYELTNTEELSLAVKNRRLNFFGHVLRLHEETPVKRAINLAFQPYKRPVGRPPLTWLSLIMKDLTNTRIFHNIPDHMNSHTFTKITELAADRDTWKQEVARSMGM